MSSKLDEQLVVPVPNERQMSIFNMGYYNFIHFGINTFTHKEWGSGHEPLSKFKLKKLDTDKWVQDLMATGSKGVIITAKHHDGFCIFPSKYTDYCIKNTAFMNGKGDVIGSLAESCKKYGFKLGFYLSPWDRHEQTYGTEAYNDYFCNQLTELCTNYGEIFCVWFDGACGEGANGKKQRYDWERYYETIHKYQPNCVISNCAYDVRWIGNEGGKCREAEWSVVPKRLQCFDEIMRASQQQAGTFAMVKIDNTDDNLGERSTIIEGEEMVFWPSEMDVSVTEYGWFNKRWMRWFFSRSVDDLVGCYLRSVGNNATLLLNIGPNEKGELPQKFIKRMIAAKEKLHAMFSEQVECEVNKVNDFEFEINFPKTGVSKVVLGEDLTKSQRVESFSLLANGIEIFKGRTIGFKKICIFEQTNTDKITLKINDSRCEPYIGSAKVYR
ncbi:MAG: alpha-L-fucosidase [Clostridia bacterium]|nr:alpha-L-fucosidase [Clostridia bacterium]